MQIGGEKSQIFYRILLIAFCQQFIVNPVLAAKHKYISCFRYVYLLLNIKYF